LEQLDELAANLKKLNQSGDQKNSKMSKVLNQIAALISDINDMSYMNMPASLAKSYVPKTNVQKPTQPPPIRPLMPSSSAQWAGFRQASTVVARPMFVQQMPFQPVAGSSSGTSSASKSKNDVICID